MKRLHVKQKKGDKDYFKISLLSKLYYSIQDYVNDKDVYRFDNA